VDRWTPISPPSGITATVIRLGFLDGQAGTAFHVLQGFWYRYLVDAKLAEVKRYMREHGADVTTAIERVLGIRV